LTHVCGDWAVDAWDQAGNQTRRPAGAAGTGRSRSGVGEAVMDDRGEILGVLKSAGLDEAWQALVDVVMVGLGASQLRGQCAVGVGVDGGLGLLVGEPAGTDEARPAVVLGGLSDGLGFGGERCDGAPGLLLGRDGPVGGELSPDMLQYAVQDGASGRVGV